MLSASAMLSAPGSDDHHFFRDLQDRIEKNLDVGEMMHYKPVIRDHPPFTSIENKQECLIDISLPVNYLLRSDSTWRNRLTKQSYILFNLNTVSPHHWRAEKVIRHSESVSFYCLTIFFIG
ncbi:hypothetical protein HMI54_012753 [Coelomomyces lativittatus]|nr:hypothetical protein HMI54_012753 [Coelomomyces lativittatus]